MLVKGHQSFGVWRFVWLGGPKQHADSRKEQVDAQLGASRVPRDRGENP